MTLSCGTKDQQFVYQFVQDLSQVIGRAAAKKNKKKRGAQIQKPKSVGTFEDRLSDIIINFNIKIEKAFEKEGADLDNHNIEQIVDAVKQSWYTTLLQEHEWNLQY